jgi:hypothetical protein
VPVETPDTTSFLRNALRACAVLFKKVVPFKAELFQARGRPRRQNSQVGWITYAPDGGRWEPWLQQPDP